MSRKTSAMIIAGICSAAGVFAIVCFHFAYLRPLVSTEQSMSAFLGEIHAHRRPRVFACPAVVDSRLIADAMHSPEVEECHVRDYRFHEERPVAGGMINPRLELHCQAIPGGTVTAVEISLLAVEGDVCGPDNGGFVVGRIETVGYDGRDRVLFRLPDEAHAKIFGP